MDKFVNYKSARILGYCLNVMGVTREESKNPDVAQACVIGVSRTMPRRGALCRRMLRASNVNRTAGICL